MKHAIVCMLLCTGKYFPIHIFVSFTPNPILYPSTSSMGKSTIGQFSSYRIIMILEQNHKGFWGNWMRSLTCNINVLSADKLQVTTLKGILGEEIELVVRVQAFPKASKWLKTLENVMKNTMAMTLQACVQTRVEEGKQRYIMEIMEIILFSKNKF